MQLQLRASSRHGEVHHNAEQQKLESVPEVGHTNQIRLAGSAQDDWQSTQSTPPQREDHSRKIFEWGREGACAPTPD